MKKFILLSLFLILTLIGFAQQRGNVFIVPTYTTNFTMSLPVHTFVYCIDSSKIYRLLAIGQPTKNLSNTVNTVYPAPVTAVLYADSSGVSGFAWKIDTTHNWGYLKTDSISSCSPLVIYSNDTSYYTALGHKFNTDIYMGGYKVLTTADTASTLLTQITAGNTYQPIGDYTEFSDTTSTLLTQSKATNTYQLKYWSKTGTAIQPYTSTDTVVSKFIRLGSIHPATTTLIKMTSTGLLDTAATTPITPIYVKKAGDTLTGSLTFNSGSLYLATGGLQMDNGGIQMKGDLKISSLKPVTNYRILKIDSLGIVDSVSSISIENATISKIKLTDSLIIGGLVYIGDTTFVYDEDSIVVRKNIDGWGSIRVDSLGTIVVWANFNWNKNGSATLINNSTRVVNTNTDGNVCLYGYSNGLIIRNRLGTNRKFKITLNY